MWFSSVCPKGAIEAAISTVAKPVGAFLASTPTPSLLQALKVYQISCIRWSTLNLGLFRRCCRIPLMTIGENASSKVGVGS